MPAFRLIFDGVYSGIILCDAESRVLYMNRFYADLLGTRPEDAGGRHIKAFFPDSRLPGVLKTGRMELGQRCSLRADVALLVNRVPIKSGGRTVGVILQTVFNDYHEINDLMSRFNLLEREIRYYKRGFDSILSASYDMDSIVGEGPRIRETRRIALKYAESDAPVLILGATGTGKELFAHAIHSASPREKAPFVCVNCAAIPRELIESELFGYETGAFTGARRRGKTGKIELAHQGTLFLDEIGDLPASAQSKLLRVLETRKFEKIGGVKPMEVDFRLVAATNVDLRAAIQRGTFREELLYRINALTVEVPSLSARSEDIPVLIAHFLRSVGREDVRISGQAMELLMRYPWPGNVRELRNAVQRVLSLIEGDTVEVEHLPQEIRELGSECRVQLAGRAESLAEKLACYEKEVLLEALRLSRGNKRKAAQLLEISRSTFYTKWNTHRLGG